MKVGQLSENISFRWILMGIIIIIIILVTGMILNINYQTSRLTLESYTLSLQENTEYSLIQSMVLVDQGLSLFDQSLDYRLRGEMNTFLSAYDESGGDPKEIDLLGLKASFGEGYDLYIINESGVIEYTTYPPDHLMDFSQFPDFFRRLTRIREGNVFVSDRITPEIQTGNLRKFVYHPTPDHRYVLEIGYIDDDLKVIRSGLLFTKATEVIQEMNPYLTSIRIFNFLADEVGNSSYIPEDERTMIISRVLESGEEFVVINPDSETKTRYLFIDLSQNGNPQEMNLVAELTYTTEPIQEQLNSLLLSHLLVAAVAILLGCIIAYTATRLITKPIHDLVRDTELIATGDLNHPIRRSQLPELRSLSLSLQQMVDRLKDVMERLQASEEELRQQNEELEERVEERTSELKEAHMKVDFYLDIITHDINNTNHTAQLYLNLLEDESDTVSGLFIEGLKNSIQKSDEIIGNVSTLRHIQDNRLNISPIVLKPILSKEVMRDDRITLSMEDEDITVMADQLLSQAFSNIIDNSLKFGGEDVRVTITAQVMGDKVEITIEDTGPGIPDSVKSQIFGRYTRGNDIVRGKGLGLFIVRTLIEDRYGGLIWVKDRVPGDHRHGASFIIRLKKGSTGR